MPSPSYRWPNDARLALSVVVNVEEGAEGTVAEGDRGPEPVDELGIVLKKPIRNYGNESNYQYGIKAGAPRVLRLLEAYGVKATFTAAAVALARDVARPAPAHHRPAGAHRRPRAVPEARRRPPGRVDRDAPRDRRAFRGAGPAAHGVSP
jgi:peptidoglycan/xylan/chitin deacetylase (PgdA/CDA1 family)